MPQVNNVSWNYISILGFFIFLQIFFSMNYFFNLSAKSFSSNYKFYFSFLI